MRITKTQLEKLVTEAVKSTLGEGDVLDFGQFKAKRERQGKLQGKRKRQGLLVTSDGQMLAAPDDFLYVVIDSDDQGDALGDGDIDKAKKLGAQFYEVIPGDRQ